MNTESETPSSDRDVMNIDQAAKFLGLSKSFLYRETAAGKIPCAKVGARTLFTKAVLLAWLEEKAKGGR